MKNFFCICFSSTLQRTVSFKNVKLENVNRSEYYRIDASGKAVNSARVLSQLEKNCTTVFCPLGKNNFRDFKNLSKKDGLKLIYAKIPGNTRTCWTLLDKLNHATTEIVVGEPALERTESFIQKEQKILKKITVYIKKNDAVLLAGSRPSVWSEDLYPEIANLAVSAGKIFLADFHGKDLQKTLEKCVPSIIKINEDEFYETFCKNDDYKSSAKDDELALKELIATKSAELKNIIIVTRGEKSTFAAKNGYFVETPSEKISTVNTTACGDSFNAGFLYEYLNSGDFEAALKKGTWCAARNAELETPGAIKE